MTQSTLKPILPIPKQEDRHTDTDRLWYKKPSRYENNQLPNGQHYFPDFERHIQYLIRTIDTCHLCQSLLAGIGPDVPDITLGGTIYHLSKSYPDQFPHRALNYRRPSQDLLLKARLRRLDRIYRPNLDKALRKELHRNGRLDGEILDDIVKSLTHSVYLRLPYITDTELHHLIFATDPDFEPEILPPTGWYAWKITTTDRFIKQFLFCLRSPCYDCLKEDLIEGRAWEERSDLVERKDLAEQYYSDFGSSGAKNIIEFLELDTQLRRSLFTHALLRFWPYLHRHANDLERIEGFKACRSNGLPSLQQAAASRVLHSCPEHLMRDEYIQALPLPGCVKLQLTNLF